MANSGHSIGFRRLFDAAVTSIAQPLKERLLETWLPGEPKPDVNQQIAQDIAHLATTMHRSKTALTWEQYAFLGDLYDRALRLPKSGTIEEFKTRVQGLAINNFYWEPPTTSLNLLRGHDAIAKTALGTLYKDFLLKVVTVTLTYVEKPGTAQDQALIDEFDAFWTEVVTATRTPQKRLHPDSSAIIFELNKAVLEFVSPARDVIRSVDQLAVMDNLKDTEGFIRRTFTNYCAQAVLADSVVDQKELELFYDLAPTLMFFGSSGSLQNLQHIFQNASKNISPTEMPLLVSILDYHDKSMNTELGDRARSLYFRIANTAFKADLTVNEEEMQWLEQFKQTLYPNGGGEGAAPAAAPHGLDKNAEEALTDVTIEQSLEELNALVGLDRVKQDFTQLVNFIKVQQMRQEKGLPGTTIPSYFVFMGNPGTGRIAVGRILANVYRADKILSKGHFVEIDRTDLAPGQTTPSAAKIQEVVSSARGGVLFIDDADALGQEAVDTLVKITEDQKDLVVILAGYAAPMEKILSANSGLKSRFNKVFQFEDYSPEQMLGIYELFCKRAAFQTSQPALAIVKSLFDQLYTERGEGFGNARDVRHVFECIIGNQANRIISLPQVNEEILSTITDADVQPIISALERPADARKIPKPHIAY